MIRGNIFGQNEYLSLLHGAGDGVIDGRTHRTRRQDEFVSKTARPGPACLRTVQCLARLKDKRENGKGNRVQGLGEDIPVVGGGCENISVGGGENGVVSGGAGWGRRGGGIFLQGPPKNFLQNVCGRTDVSSMGWGRGRLRRTASSK